MRTSLLAALRVARDEKITLCMNKELLPEVSRPVSLRSSQCLSDGHEERKGTPQTEGAFRISVSVKV